MIHKIILKQALNHGLVFKHKHKVIKFNQNSCLKSYIDMKKLLKILENIGIVNLLQLKEERIVSYQNQIIILQSFLQKIY